MVPLLVSICAAQVQPINVDALLADYFSQDSRKRSRASEALALLPWTKEYESKTIAHYQKWAEHDSLKADFEKGIVKTDDRTAQFKFRIVGTPNGKPMPLVFALHGGGSGPPSLNNSQWDGMFNGYYRDKPESGPYIYCALRAPNDEWNGFYDDSIAQLIERLIFAFSLFGNADVNRVSITGASHGGYGAFVIAPKIPFRFASANASASAPTDGETEGINLRNLHFTWMIGGKDNAFGRPERCEKFADSVKEWREEHGGFEGGMTFLPETGHSVPDRDIVSDLLRIRRNSAPSKVIWVQTDERVKNHYWLTDPFPKPGRKIYAELTDKSVTIVNTDAAQLVIRIPTAIAVKAKTFTVVWGKSSTITTINLSLASFASTLASLGDPAYASPAEITVDNPNLNELK